MIEYSRSRLRVQKSNKSSRDMAKRKKQKSNKETVPKPASIARKRAGKISRVKEKQPSTSFLTATSENSKKQNITPASRIVDFPNQYFASTVDGKLQCQVCWVYIQFDRKSTVAYHINSKKHQQRLAQKAESNEQDFGADLQQFQSERRVMANELAEGGSAFVGDTLEVAHQLWRVKVVSAFLEAGIALEKLNNDSIREVSRNRPPCSRIFILN